MVGAKWFKIAIACSSTLTSMSAEELAALDLDHLDCDNPRMLSAEQGLKEWQEALSLMQTGAFERDIKELKALQMLA